MVGTSSELRELTDSITEKEHTGGKSYIMVHSEVNTNADLTINSEMLGKVFYVLWRNPVKGWYQ
ncbi:hypothetical protein DPMN_160112 [Dreissena polymorpha]|uniref:Uncharacterized protein n=1 Tax=Dreissena polymorpha TaxID=45954 RepID=A0A9D4ELP9_DREPO|nr:hypothetical protein DPMN_160112 [Dreissena polymorpha]